MNPPAAPVVDAAAWCREARTRDGVTYRIRPIAGSDSARERDFITGLSDQSRHNRFMSGLREPSRALVDQLVHVDYRDSMALVATTGDGDAEAFIGIARYARDDARALTEFAVSVADAWQNRGVATELLTRLFEYARAQGLTRLVGWTLADNDSMLDVAHAFEMQVRPAPDDSALREIVVRLDSGTSQGSA